MRRNLCNQLAVFSAHTSAEYNQAALYDYRQLGQIQLQCWKLKTFFFLYIKTAFSVLKFIYGATRLAK